MSIRSLPGQRGTLAIAALGPLAAAAVMVALRSSVATPAWL